MNDNNPRTDEPYAADSPAEEVHQDDAFFPHARNYWPSGWPTWAPWYKKDVQDEAEDRDQMYGEDVETTEPAKGGSRREESIIGLLLVAGIVLFVFPEPATSMVGALLIVAGVVGWLWNRFA